MLGHGKKKRRGGGSRPAQADGLSEVKSCAERRERGREGGWWTRATRMIGRANQKEKEGIEGSSRLQLFIGTDRQISVMHTPRTLALAVQSRLK